MAKVKSPLKTLRLDLDLSKSELASLVFPNREDRIIKGELSQAIALCEAGLLNPGDFGTGLKYLFDFLSKAGHQTIRKDQEDWINRQKESLGSVYTGRRVT